MCIFGLIFIFRILANNINRRTNSSRFRSVSASLVNSHFSKLLGREKTIVNQLSHFVWVDILFYSFWHIFCILNRIRKFIILLFNYLRLDWYYWLRFHLIFTLLFHFIGHLTLMGLLLRPFTLLSLFLDLRNKYFFFLRYWLLFHFISNTLIRFLFILLIFMIMMTMTFVMRVFFHFIN